MKKILIFIVAIAANTYLFAQGTLPVNEKKTGNVTRKSKETNQISISSFDFTGAATGDMLKFNGTKWVKYTPPSTTFGNCESCHNATNQKEKLAQYQASKHFNGRSSSRNSKYCARCHTNQGFQEITSNGTFTVSADMPNGIKITCKTCHSHSAFDMTGDSTFHVLRTTSPVYLAYNKFASATDFGKIDNLCVTCHQIRGVSGVTPTLPFFPFDYSQSPTADVQYRQGQSFSVHDGNQSNLFFGINGYEYPGKTYTRKWKHSDMTCTKCHMNQYNPANETGGHTLKCNLDACTACHKGANDLSPVVVSISAKLKELGDLLVARKILNKSYNPVTTHDYNGLLYDGTITTVYTSISADNTVSPTTGLVIYGTKLTTGTDDATIASTRIGRPWKWGELGAAYNYGFIKSESPSRRNYGVHNPVYALQLLQNSIDWLKAN
jgi:hypothetical protein